MMCVGGVLCDYINMRRRGYKIGAIFLFNTQPAILSPKLVITNKIKLQCMLVIENNIQT